MPLEASGLLEDKPLKILSVKEFRLGPGCGVVKELKKQTSPRVGEGASLFLAWLWANKWIVRRQFKADFGRGFLDTFDPKSIEEKNLNAIDIGQ